MATKPPNLTSAPLTPGAVSVLVEGNRLVFRTDNSQSIYVSDADKPGLSMCTAGCAAKWKPVPAPADARPVGDWTVILRTGGAKQWAYKGRPIYTYAEDDGRVAKGDGAEGIWHVLNP